MAHFNSDEGFEDDFPLYFGESRTGAVRGFWATDRSEEKTALVVGHRKEDGTVCAGSVFIRPWANRPVWDVISMEPLTLAPSILCDCGFHGFIRDGKWEDA